MDKSKEKLVFSIYDIKIRTEADEEVFPSFQFDRLVPRRHHLYIEGFEGDFLELKEILNTVNTIIKIYFDIHSLFENL